MSIHQPTQNVLLSYGQKGQDAALSAPYTTQLAVYLVRAFNRSGGAIDVGIVRKYASGSFKLFTYNASVYSEVSLPLSAATQIMSTTTGHGFVAQFKSKAGLLGMNLSQASASGTYVYEYWNGSAWTTLTTIEVPGFTTTGVKLVVFLPPHDWAIGGGGALDSAMYSIRVTNSAGIATALKIDSLWAGQLLEFYESVADNQSVVLEFPESRPMILQGNESIMPYFGSANAANGVSIQYTTV